MPSKSAEAYDMKQKDIEFLVVCLRNSTGALLVDAGKVAKEMNYDNARSVGNRVTILKKKYGFETAIKITGVKNVGPKRGASTASATSTTPAAQATSSTTSSAIPGPNPAISKPTPTAQTTSIIFPATPIPKPTTSATPAAQNASTISPAVPGLAPTTSTHPTTSAAAPAPGLSPTIPSIPTTSTTVPAPTQAPTIPGAPPLAGPETQTPNSETTTAKKATNNTAENPPHKVTKIKVEVEADGDTTMNDVEADVSHGQAEASHRLLSPTPNREVSTAGKAPPQDPTARHIIQEAVVKTEVKADPDERMDDIDIDVS